MVSSMREMKDSGIEWIGRIPFNWKMDKLGNYFIERKEKVSDVDFEPLSVTKRGIVQQLEGVAKTKNNNDRKRVAKGDFVINSRSDRKQSCGLSALNGSVSVINTVLTPRNIEHELVKYLLDNYGFAEEFFRWGYGIHFDLWSTKFTQMKSILLPIPSDRDMQQKIATYLDQKVVIIDNIIEKTKESIEEYKAYKQSLITETVTKGLNPDVKMKDSGIEWVGEIPEHWEVQKIKYVLDSITKKNLYDYNYIGLENIEKETGRFLDVREKTTQGGDTLSYENNCLLFGKLRPYLAKVYKTNSQGCCSSEFLVMKNIKGDIDFYFYRLLSGDFIEIVNSSTYGTKMPRASWEFIKNLRISIPPFVEQKEIKVFLKEKVDVIEELIDSKMKLIQELELYKKSLIYEVVTGKKDI